MTSVDTRAARTIEDADKADSPIPELVRVSVLGGNTQLDIALPAEIPIAALINDLVTHIQSRNPGRHGTDDPDEGAPEPSPHTQWTLSRIGQAPIPVARSLADSGVRDGDLLIVTPSDATDAPALFDDVVDAVARLTESGFASWSPTAARVLGYVAAVVAAVVAATSLGAVRLESPATWPALAAMSTTVGLVIASTIVARHYRDRATSAVLSATAIPLSFVAGILCIPGDYHSPHLAMGCAAVLLTTVTAYRLSAVGAILHCGAATVSILLGATALAATLVDTSLQYLAAIAAVCGLLVGACAPRLTIVLAKLPLPPVPTAGSAFDAAEMEPSPAIAGIGAIGAMVLPKADALEHRSRLANSYLTGIVAGAATTTAAFAVLAAAPWSGIEPKSTALALIIAAVLCLRGRSHGDLAQACTLIGSGLLITVIVIGSPVLENGRNGFGSFGAAMLLLVGSLILGVLAARHEFTPVMRRTAELVEYGLVVAIVPLLMWILDVYQSVRNI